MAKKVLFKNKEQLDSMSKKEIEDFRLLLFQQYSLDDNAVRRYSHELDLYLNIRFKADVLAMYERWRKKKDDPNTYPDDREAMKLLVNLIDKMGEKEYYNFFIEQDKKKLGEFQYVK